MDHKPLVVGVFNCPVHTDTPVRFKSYWDKQRERYTPNSRGQCYHCWREGLGALTRRASDGTIVNTQMAAAQRAARKREARPPRSPYVLSDTKPETYSDGDWAGRRASKMREQVKSEHEWPHPCPDCGQPLHIDGPWQIDHLQPRRLHPERTFDPTNVRAVCKPCNLRDGLLMQSVLRIAEHCCDDCLDTLATLIGSDRDALANYLHKHA